MSLPLIDLSRACYLRFCNYTSRHIKVIWIDTVNGATVNDLILDPHSHLDMWTYEDCTWRCEDLTTLTCMLLNNSKIFVSTAKYVEHSPQSLQILEGRLEISYDVAPEIVEITLPMLSLKEASIDVVRKNLHSKEDIAALRIPNLIKAQLQEYFIQ